SGAPCSVSPTTSPGHTSKYSRGGPRRRGPRPEPALSEPTLVRRIRKELALRLQPVEPLVDPAKLDEDLLLLVGRLAVLVVGVLADEVAGDRGGGEAQKADADDHQECGDHPSDGRGREGVAVADGGDGDD